MKSRLIVNPVSGSDSAPSQLTLINARLREHVGAMDIVMTVDRGDAARAAAAALRDGYDHLFVAGGDGTLNEVVNGVGATRRFRRDDVRDHPARNRERFRHGLGDTVRG